MEGRHCVAGPWFTALKIGGDWQTLDKIWISNGRRSTRAVFQARLAWTEE